MTTPQRSERFQRGIELIQQMFPGQETRTMPVVAPVRRDWGMYTVETALVRPAELRIHLRGALRNGLTRHELSEILLHLSLYGGFPVAVEGLRLAREVFDAEQPPA